MSQSELKTANSGILSEPDYIFKIFLAGDSGVGKSSLLNRLVDDKFSEDWLPTLGIDFMVKKVQVDNKIVRLQYWDTAGQERMRTIVVPVAKSAHGVVLVYDVTNLESFNNVQSWIELIDQQGNDDIQKLLIGNKCDMERVVDYQTAKDYADKLGISYVETSAKNATNVEQAFTKFTEDIKNEIDSSRPMMRRANMSRAPGSIQINDIPVKRRANGCC